MSARVTALVWGRSRAKGSALLALLALAEVADEGGHADPPGGLAGLARRIRMSERNTRLVVRELERAGELRVRYGAGPRGSHHFDLVLGDPLVAAPVDDGHNEHGGKDDRAAKTAGARIAEVGASYAVGVGMGPDNFAGVGAEECAGHTDTPDRIAGGEGGRADRITGVGADNLAGAARADRIVPDAAVGSTSGASAPSGHVGLEKIAGVADTGREAGRRRDHSVDGSGAETHRSEDPDHLSSEVGGEARGPVRRGRRVFGEDEPAMALARHLRMRILANLPGARVPDTPGKLQAWAAVMDLLLRVDGRTPSEVEGLIDWCEADSFWRSVILSAGALRDKWERLVLQRERQEGRHAAAGRGGGWGSHGRGARHGPGGGPEPGSEEYYAARRGTGG